MSYTITRQVQWPDGHKVVEVSEGGLDYTNPDALSPAYPGEFEEYVDPEAAAEVAIYICDQWRQNGGPDAQVAHGATGGMTIPFSPCSYEELRDWASALAGGLPRCDWCAEPLPQGGVRHPELPDERFCREYCAEEAFEEVLVTEPVEVVVCDSCVTVAYDHGVMGLARQVSFMVEAGELLEDHLCDHREAPEAWPSCACGCNYRG